MMPWPSSAFPRLSVGLHAIDATVCWPPRHRCDRVFARRCIDEIYKYSLCLQSSACAASGAKPDSRATTARCQGAPTDAAITQLVEERVRATGDDEATARAYLTSYDLCAKWGDEETKQPDRSRRTRANCPAGCDYVTNCQYASEVWDPVYNWTDRETGVTTLYNRTGEVLASV